ncbi:hypothetical protein N7516_005762 [Penicillium verrucosum]|uniref:uncharacterized protein n=1 Tax=Penicillium verrucosum TaxID=60171 RepID=UPI0025454AD4|nr:uncharacterized protein N7516_005762 [Penicillium verrucosum]KAJ5931273.1 hypothetical protein N7516_005762 [Penicillium verrucosum]
MTTRTACEGNARPQDRLVEARTKERKPTQEVRKTHQPRESDSSRKSQLQKFANGDASKHDAYDSLFDHTRQLYAEIDSSKDEEHSAMIFHVKAEWTHHDLKKPPPANVVEPVMFLSRLLSPAEQRY